MGCFPGYIFNIVCVKQISQKPILKSPMMTPQICASYCLSGTTYIEPAVAILKVSSTMSENGCGLNGPVTRCTVVNVGVAGPILVQHEGRWRQRRRADLRQFWIFRRRPVIVCTRLPAEGTYYPICMFHTNSESLIGISDAFFAFCLRVSVILPTCSLYPPTKARLLCATPAGMESPMPVGTYRVQSLGFPKIVYSEANLTFYVGPTPHPWRFIDQ